MRQVFKFIKEHFLILIIIFVACFSLLWTFVDKITAPKRDEQVDFAITTFAHHDEGKKEEFEKLLESDGIKEVNLSYFDISDSERTAEYLLTYGHYMADVFVLDTVLGQSVLNDCFYTFSEEQISELNKAVGFELKRVNNETGTVGILIHEKGNDEYNGNFTYCNQWLLFEAEGQDFDYAVFFNYDSDFNKTSNFDLLKYIIGRR